MKLILPSDFKNLQDNDEHGYLVDRNTNKEVLKIYFGEKLIAKRIKMSNKKKGAVRYFGVDGYEDYLTEDYKIQQIAAKELKKK